MTESEKQKLGKTLWAIADQLRGAMDADDFRDYMLSFLFLRYLSDNYETAAKKELGRDYPDVKDDARKVPIPRFGQALQAGIAKVYATAEQALRSAEARSADAERRLLAELQLADWNPPRPLHYVCRSGEAFGAERLDAEHFQPGYAALVERLRATGPAASLGSLLLSNERGSQPDYAEEGLPVVNSKHVGRGSVTIDVDDEGKVQLQFEEVAEVTV